MEPSYEFLQGSVIGIDTLYSIGDTIPNRDMAICIHLDKMDRLALREGPVCFLIVSTQCRIRCDDAIEYSRNAGLA